MQIILLICKKKILIVQNFIILLLILLNNSNSLSTWIHKIILPIQYLLNFLNVDKDNIWMLISNALNVKLIHFLN